MTKKKYKELENVRYQRRAIQAEEFPDGAYGAAIPSGSTASRQEDEFPVSSFTYANRTFHAGLERDVPGSHPTHSETEEV